MTTSDTSKSTSKADAGNTATEVPSDRVAMLSLNADGTPDQTNPTIIGDKAYAQEATRQQFAEQAVSAADDNAKAGLVDGAGGETLEQDPSIAKAQAQHESIAKAAEKRADAVVDQLHEG